MEVNVYELSALLGDYIEADTENWGFNCPFCINKVGMEDVDHHLVIHKKSGKWQCWRCETANRKLSVLYSLLGATLHQGIANFIDNLDDLLCPAQATTAPDEVVESEQLIKLPLLLTDIQHGDDAYFYLVRFRELIDEQIIYYRLKQCFIYADNKYHRSIFIPIYQAGQLVFYQTRSIEGKIMRNSRGRDKRRYVGNIDHEENYSIICEGPISGIRAGMAGVWLLGKDCSDIQLAQLVARNDSCYFCALESDYFQKNLDLAAKLYAAGMSVRVLVLPFGEDPASLSTFEFQKLIADSIPYNKTMESEMRLAYHAAEFNKIRSNIYQYKKSNAQIHL